MLLLPSKLLSAETMLYLKKLQEAINNEPSHESQKNKAIQLWDDKNNTIAGKQAFQEIKEKLISMCVGVQICNYCETNEASEIEHIYPKSKFPQFTFDWENYILACHNCNKEKLDHFKIFKDTVSTETIKLNRSIKPLNDDAVFINPRKEDSTKTIRLNLVSETYLFDPINDITKREAERVEYTVKVLKLNERETLSIGRKNKAIEYLSKLSAYIKVKESVTFDDLDNATHGIPAAHRNENFDSEKQRISENIKNSFTKLEHPTVWFELKRQKENLPRTKSLLEQAPEALSW